ncbi:hypothetical protein HaLaN_15528, partial [Haematococcus lacustris]
DAPAKARRTLDWSIDVAEIQVCMARLTMLAQAAGVPADVMSSTR